MHKMLVAMAATAALTSAALFAGAKPAVAQIPSATSPMAALQDGDLQTSYVQHRGRGGGVHRGGGRGAYRGGYHGGNRAAYRGGAYRGGAYRGAYRGGYGGVYRGGPRYGYGRPYYGRPYYGGYYGGYNYGGAAAAGALGLATGAIVGGAIAQQQPVYAAPGNAVAYCAQRYKSYDARSGTYLGYDGLRHSCP